MSIDWWHEIQSGIELIESIPGCAVGRYSEEELLNARKIVAWSTHWGTKENPTKESPAERNLRFFESSPQYREFKEKEQTE